MTLTRRLTKGSSLTAAEHDGNIDHLADGSNIKDAYEGEANTNAFTDALLSKLNAIELNATADQTGAEIIAAIDGEGRQIPTDAEFAAFLNDAAAFATAAQGTLADTATQPGDNISTLTNDAGFVAGQTFTQGEKDKLAGLEDSLFLGVYTSLAALQTAHPSPVTGSYAHVDTGVGQDIAQYIWDDNDSLYAQAIGTGTADTAAQVKTKYESNPDTNNLSDTLLAKLNAIEANATADQTGAEIKGAYEAEPDTNAFTDAEKSKLAGLEDSLFLGLYTSLAALQTAHPSPVVGSYAYVDTGVGNDIVQYLWDDDDTAYVQSVGTGTADTPAQVKTKYESNANTNPFTDAERDKLASITPLADPGGSAIAFFRSSSGEVEYFAGLLGLTIVDDVLRADVQSVAGQTGAITRPALQDAINVRDVTITLVVANPGDAMTVGDQKNYWRVPAMYDGYSVVSVIAYQTAAGVTGDTTYQLRKNALDLFSTGLVIASGADESAAASLNGANTTLATGDKLSPDLDSVATGTAPEGGRLEIILRSPT